MSGSHLLATIMIVGVTLIVGTSERPFTKLTSRVARSGIQPPGLAGKDASCPYTNDAWLAANCGLEAQNLCDDEKPPGARDGSSRGPHG